MNRYQLRWHGGELRKELRRILEASQQQDLADDSRKLLKGLIGDARAVLAEEDEETGKACSHCGGPVSPERIAANHRWARRGASVTCSPECADEWRKNPRRKAQYRKR